MTRSQLLQRLIDSQASNETIANVMHVWKLPTTIPTLDEIAKACATACFITVDEMKSRHKTNIMTQARYLFVDYFRQNFKHAHTLEELGKYLGGRDHTTMVHAEQTAKSHWQTNDAGHMHYLNNLQLVLSGQPPIPVKKYIAPVSKYRCVKIVKYYYDRHEDINYRTIGDLSLGVGYATKQNIKYLRRRLGKDRFEVFREVLP